ncbi:MAG: GerMN domain-containing protein [Bacillota bacterium]
MKNLDLFKFIFMVSIILILIVGGCTPVVETPANGENNEEEAVEISLGDYYPFVHDAIYEYEGLGNEFAEQTVFLEFENGQRGQYRAINPGTETVKIIEKTADSVREIYLEGEFYHTENILSTPAIKNNILLKEPLVKGNSWELEDGYIREITDLEKDIETPYGAFKAIEVTTYFEEDRMQKNYYVKDVGMVAVEYLDGETQISSLLRNIVSGPYEKDIRLFYPLERNNEIITTYLDYSFKFSTNDHLENIFEKLFKEPVEESLTPVISEDTLINSIFLDKGTWTVKVDFSSELIPGWNAGSSLELELIRSIVNTLGEFYDTERVYMSIEGVPFVSGHYGMTENEVFTVDTEGIDEYEDYIE